MIGCSSKNTDNKASENLGQKGSNMKITDLFNTEIPVPSNAIIKDNTFIITGEQPYQVIGDYSNSLSENGWKQISALGAKRFYEKEINNKKTVISVLPKEKGGPQVETISTIIQLQISSDPDKRKKSKEF